MAEINIVDAGPKRVRSDNTEAENFDLHQQIELDRYLASKSAMSCRRRGLRFTKMIGPGAVFGINGDRDYFQGKDTFWPPYP